MNTTLDPKVMDNPPQVGKICHHWSFLQPHQQYSKASDWCQAFTNHIWSSITQGDTFGMCFFHIYFMHMSCCRLLPRDVELRRSWVYRLFIWDCFGISTCEREGREPMWTQGEVALWVIPEDSLCRPHGLALKLNGPSALACIGWNGRAPSSTGHWRWASGTVLDADDMVMRSLCPHSRKGIR